MNNRLKDIEIPVQNPYENDRLGRYKSVEVLMTMAKMYARSGCVIAINGEWGSGKTTFVKMTMQQMRKEGGHPLYFNAWEHDYVSDPLIALLSELEEINPQPSNEWKSVLVSGGRIAVGMANSIIKGVLKNKIGIDSEALFKGLDEAENIMKEDIDKYSNQKKSLQDFKNALRDYVAINTGEDKPVVFFIDELDRCNPHFAVKVLERIKHLFEIPNLIFVISICKKQLEHAIQGYYGSPNIDATNYLRRFIDIEFTLPIPNTQSLIEYLYEYYDFDNFFTNQARIRSCGNSENRDFKDIASTLVENIKLDIRTIDKIFAHSRLALQSFSNNESVVPNVLFILCYIRITDYDFYRGIEKKTYEVQQLLTKLVEKFPNALLSNNDNLGRHIMYSIFALLKMYDRDLIDGEESRSVFRLQDGEQSKLLCAEVNQQLFEETYKRECKGRAYNSLKDIIIKINLQNSILST